MRGNKGVFYCHLLPFVTTYCHKTAKNALISAKKHRLFLQKCAYSLKEHSLFQRKMQCFLQKAQCFLQKSVEKGKNIPPRT